MQIFPTTAPITSFLQTAPKTVIASLAAVYSLTVIGAINTVSFAINKTADLIAWAANDRREESWAPFVTAIFILSFLARLLIMKLLQDQPANTINPLFIPEQMEAAVESFTTNMRTAQIQPASHSASTAPGKLPSPATNVFPSESQFAKNLKNAGSKLFEQPTSSSTLFSPPPATTSTRPPSPADSDDKLLNDAFNELKAHKTK